MSTKTVVDEIKRKAPAWPRDGQNSICQMLNRAQNYLFSKPCRISVYIDKTTGRHPFLTTVAGQYEYDIPNGSVVLAGIVTPRPIRMFLATEVYTMSSTAAQEYSRVLQDRGDISIQATRIIINSTNIEALENTPAKIIFPFDPGDSTDKYQYEAIFEPLQIASDSIPLMVPKIWELALIDGTLGNMEYFDYGRSDRLQTFMEVHAPAFWAAYPSVLKQNQQTATMPRKF
jgi:hypothetical protein